MKVTRITIVVLRALTMLLLAPLEANAGAQGVGMRTSHVGGQHVVRGHRALARHHFRSVRNQAFGAWPWYGSYDEPPYTYDDSIDLLGARDSRGQTRSARGWMSTY